MCVHVVWDPDDHLEFGEQLAARAATASGVVLVQPTPGITTTDQLAVDVLIGLGKPYDALVRERLMARAWYLARLWLHAERAKHLIVIDAQRLGPQLRDAVARLGIANSWEIHRHRRPTWSATIDPAALLGSVPSPAPTPVVYDLEDLHLPDANFLTFRAACRDLLPADAFRRVDAVYHHARHATHAWLDRELRRSLPSSAAITDQLRSLVSEAASLQELTVQLRAAQAAYFVAGALITLHPRCYPPTRSTFNLPVDLPAVGLSRELTRRLRRLASPRDAAAMTLATTGLGPAGLVGLKVGDISAAGHSVVISHGESPHPQSLPDHATALVRVQVLDRRSAGARGREPLFVNSNNKAVLAHNLARFLGVASKSAHTWSPADELRPLWHPQRATGYMVEITGLAWPWRELA